MQSTFSVIGSRSTTLDGGNAAATGDPLASSMGAGGDPGRVDPGTSEGRAARWHGHGGRALAAPWRSTRTREATSPYGDSALPQEAAPHVFSAQKPVLKMKTSSSGPAEFELRVSDQTMWTTSLVGLAAMLE